MSLSLIRAESELIVVFFNTDDYIIDPSIADVFVYDGDGINGEATILPVAKPIWIKNRGSGQLRVRYNNGGRFDGGHYLPLETVPSIPDNPRCHGAHVYYHASSDSFIVLTTAEVSLGPEG